MDTTPNLNLPYIMAAQAQKHVTHNEALISLDALVQLSVLRRSLAAPPATAAEGDRYIPAAGATGAWAGKDGAIALFRDGHWVFYAAKTGWTAWVSDENATVVWNGSMWAAAAGNNNPTPLVGINATADATNRLSLSSPAALFNHNGAGHQLKINKATASDTASLMWQTGFSGRSELGLTGSDDFHIKVSGDGATWRDALVIDRTTAVVSMPNTPAQNNAGSSYLLNASPANLHFWSSKLNRMLRYGERPRVNLYGDSTTLGSGGVLQKNSPGERLALELTRRGIAAHASLFGMPMATGAALGAFEPRLTFSGTWSPWGETQGSSPRRAASPSASLSYAPGYACDSFSLFWFRGGLFGNEGAMTISVNGGATLFSTPTSGGLVSSQTISVVGADATQELVITVPSLGNHTLTITNGATGQILVFGIEAYDSTTGCVLVRCMGSPSLTSRDLVTTSRRQNIWQMPCDLSVLSTGINDWTTAAPVATYAANLATLIGDMRINSISDVLFWTPPGSDPATVSTAVQSSYVNAMKAAAGNTVVVADLWQRYSDLGGYAALGPPAAGYYNDALHPSAYGNLDIARFLAAALTRS